MKNSIIKKCVCVGTAAMLLLTMQAGAISTIDTASSESGDWAYSAVKKMTDNGIFEESVWPCQMLSALYKFSGESGYKCTFNDHIIYLDSSYESQWYTDAVNWAAYNGISHIYWEGGSTEPGIAASYVGCSRYGVTDGYNSLEYYREKVEYSKDESNYSYVSSLRIPTRDWGRPVTRSDIVLSLYYYLTIYLGIIPTESASLDSFSDWPDMENIPADQYCQFQMAVPSGDLEKAWSWAAGSGIIKGYPDNTLRIGYIYNENERVTRAEFAVILDRFMNYIESVR